MVSDAVFGSYSEKVPEKTFHRKIEYCKKINNSIRFSPEHWYHVRAVLIIDGKFVRLNDGISTNNLEKLLCYDTLPPPLGLMGKGLF